MRLALTTARLITETGTFDRVEIMREAWKVYRRWHRYHEPAKFAARFANILRQIWTDAREQLATTARLEASRAAFRAAEAHRRAAAETPAGRALVAELSSLVYLDDWRHAEFRRAEIEATLARLAA